MRRTVARACLVALGLLAAAAAGAQVMGLYYQEVEKDGRVYVFNTPERYTSFAESGEIGTAITLPGRGKNGETVVAENETALDLYLFKHDLPGYDRPMPKPEKKFDDRVFYKDGKTNIVMKAGTVQISNRVQARYTDADVDPGTTADISSFRIRRAKTTIEGNAYGGLWRFKLQANWVGVNAVNSVSLSNGVLSTSVTRSPTLEDAEIWYAKNPMATVWLGQGKAFFGRQELTSSGRQQFVDRSITSTRFAPGRDQGLGLIGVNKGKTFEYNLGIYNGNLLNQAANDNDEFMYIGRVVWTPFGEYKLEESSLDYPSSPRLAIGSGYLKNTLGKEGSQTDISRFGAEIAFKIKGFNLVGEYYDEEADAQATGITTNTDGYYLQAGYLFPNRKFEIAGRVAEINPEGVGLLGGNDTTEEGAALSWYWDKHNHKIQTDYLKVENEGTGTEATEWRLQLQLVF